ncbi:MAG: chemotaxis protein CheX [Thermodesulfobacteriota bacterium]
MPMDAKMINPFLQATLEILQEVASIQFRVGKFYVKTDAVGRGDVTGIIGLTGSGKGTVAVTFDEKMILTIVSKILDEEMREINDLVIDAAGELTNMITGRVVDKLARNGFDLMLSVPTVVHGTNHRVVHHTKGPKIAIPFSAAHGRFVVEFSFDREPDFSQPESGEASPEIKAETPAAAADGKAPVNWGTPSSD